MFLGSPLPSWKQIFTISRAINKKSFYEELYPDVLFLAESCMSIRLILNAIKSVGDKTSVKVLLPDYFCNQTMYSFKETWVDIVFYPIKKDMDPDWNYLKTWTKENEFDVLLFTHYFGRYHENISRAKDICDNHNAVLIEDCAHVLYPTRKMGANGDFVIYSPHKQLPIMDGGVLVCNENNKKTGVSELYKWIKGRYETLPTRSDSFSWCIKKALQKILPLHRRLNYYSGIHNSTDIGKLPAIERISRGSYNTLCDYEYMDYKKIAYNRRDNLEMMNYIINLKYPEVIPLMTSAVDVPYFAVYSLEKVQDKAKVTTDMLSAGLTLLYWPDLPYQMNGVEGHDDMKKLSEDIIVMPIHQDISQQGLVKKFLERVTKDENEIILKKVTREEYMTLYPSYEVSNIPQEWIYGNTKQSTEGWRVVRYKVIIGGSVVGLLQILEKKIMGITVAVRVNRGPVMENKYNTAIIKFQVMEEVRRKYIRPIPIIYAPSVDWSARNVHIATSFNWKCINRYGFPSAIVDLSLTEEEFHKKLKAFWRKNLNHAKKCVTIKYNEYDPEEIISLYGAFLKFKNIPGIPEHILRYLFNLSDNPLEILTAHNEDGIMIAFKGLYKHGNCGTSLIAWNTDEGRAKQARTLLIWSSMLRLKKLGYRYFDLGGVDDINTEAVAKYKRGAGGKEYRLLGEYARL